MPKVAQNQQHDPYDADNCDFSDGRSWPLFFRKQNYERGEQRKKAAETTGQAQGHRNFKVRPLAEARRPEPDDDFLVIEMADGHLIPEELKQWPDRHQRDRENKTSNQPA